MELVVLEQADKNNSADIDDAKGVEIFINSGVKLPLCGVVYMPVSV